MTARFILNHPIVQMIISLCFILGLCLRRPSRRCAGFVISFAASSLLAQLLFFLVFFMRGFQSLRRAFHHEPKREALVIQIVISFRALRRPHVVGMLYDWAGLSSAPSACRQQLAGLERKI